MLLLLWQKRVAVRPTPVLILRLPARCLARERAVLAKSPSPEKPCYAGSQSIFATVLPNTAAACGSLDVGALTSVEDERLPAAQYDQAQAARHNQRSH